MMSRQCHGNAVVCSGVRELSTDITAVIERVVEEQYISLDKLVMTN